MKPTPGAVLHLPDEQYRFGAGPLICRVIEVMDLLTLDCGPPWWHVRGECALGIRSQHGGWHERELYVVCTAVRRADPHRRAAGPHLG